jgi:hypothetical protein
VSRRKVGLSKQLDIRWHYTDITRPGSAVRRIFKVSRWIMSVLFGVLSCLAGLQAPATAANVDDSGFAVHLGGPLVAQPLGSGNTSVPPSSCSYSFTYDLWLTRIGGSADATEKATTTMSTSCSNDILISVGSSDAAASQRTYEGVCCNGTGVENVWGVHTLTESSSVTVPYFSASPVSATSLSTRPLSVVTFTFDDEFPLANSWFRECATVQYEISEGRGPTILRSDDTCPGQVPAA